MAGVNRRGIVRRARRCAALLVAAALLNFSAPAGFASAPPAPVVGEVVIAGALTIGGSPAVSGQTFFSGSAFATPPDSTSVLSLSNLARLELSGATVIRVDFTGADLTGSLGAGAARFFVPEGVGASVETADASVLTDKGEAVVFSVNASPEGTTLSVETGRVEMRAGGVAQTVGAGQVFSASRGSAPQASQGQNLSERGRAALVVGIAAALVAVIIAITGRRDDVEEPPCEGVPIVPSGPTDPFPC